MTGIISSCSFPTDRMLLYGNASSFHRRYVSLRGRWRWNILPSLLAHPFHVKLITVSYVIEIGIADNGSEERRVPYPVIGNHDQFGSQCQQYQYVDERLMIGYQDGRLLNVSPVRFIFSLCTNVAIWIRPLQVTCISWQSTCFL